MPRKSTKNAEATMNAIDEAINTPVNFQFCEVAEELGIGEAELRERLEDKLGNSEVHQMDTIPVEWEPALKAIKIDLEAESSVRRLEAPTEPPILEDEPQQKKRGGRSKKEVTALTQQRKEGLEKKEKGGEKLKSTRKEVKRKNAVQRGQKSGAQLAAIKLTAEQLTYATTKPYGER